jgi:hypothetical protein
MTTLPTVYVPRGAGPFAGVGRALTALTGFGRPRQLARSPIGLGEVDMTNLNLMSAAQALNDYLTTTGCSVAVIPQVQAFQQAWITAGGTLPNDTGGRSPVDGYYGANTAAALQLMFSGAPNGCVGAASGGAGAAAATNPTQSVSDATLTGQDPISYYFSDVMGGGPSLWWTLGIVGVVAVVAVAKPGAFKMYPGYRRDSGARFPKKRKAKKRAKRKSPKRGKRRAARGGKRGNRRRNPAPPPFSRSHARHEIVRPSARPLSPTRRSLIKMGVPPHVVADMDDEMAKWNELILSGDLIGVDVIYPRKWKHLEPPPEWAMGETPRRRKRR